jgi:ParB family chromosome partitioning protein
MMVDIEKIEVGERLRSRLDPVKLQLLADDMERNGQLQEIVVAIKWGANGRGTTVIESATLIAGYRRLEAAKLLGWTQIRCTRQLGGDIDPDSVVDLLRAEFSENEMREDFTEMERVAFGVKIKECIAEVARERMLAGKKVDYEYDPETGNKVWRQDDIELTDDKTSDPWVKIPKGIDDSKEYSGGRASEYAAKEIGMSDKKFRQGEYVLKHGSDEQHTAINRGEASISGVYNELKQKTKKSSPAVDVITYRDQPAAPANTTYTLKDTVTAEQESSETDFYETPARPVVPLNIELPSSPKHKNESSEELAMEALTPKEREAVECHSALNAMTSEQKVVELQSQLKSERSRAVAAESELARLKVELHNAVYHRDEIIESHERQLEAAYARIKEREDKYEPNQHTT